MKLKLSQELVSKQIHVIDVYGGDKEGKVAYFTPDYDSEDYVAGIGFITQTEQIYLSETDIVSIEIIE